MEGSQGVLLYRTQGLLLAFLAAVSILDGWRITREAREGANFDAIGPDRYLIALGVAMLAVGLYLALKPSDTGSKSAKEDADPSNTALRSLVSVTAALAVFALAMPYLGFTIGNFVFIAYLTRLFGDWPWWRSLCTAAVVTAVFYVSFVMVADVALPKGMLGF
jgi:hypothetical protein